MQLTKRQALTIVKCLSALTVSDVQVDAAQDDIDDLEEAVEDFLTCDAPDDSEGEEEESEDEEEGELDECSVCGGTGLDSAGSDDEGEEDGKLKAESDEDDGDDLCDSRLSCEELHDLSLCNATSDAGKPVRIEFEHCPNGDVDLLDEGSCIVEDIINVKREAHGLYVQTSSGEWHAFEVKKFPKSWSKLLPLGELVGLE